MTAIKYTPVVDNDGDVHMARVDATALYVRAEDFERLEQEFIVARKAWDARTADLSDSEFRYSTQITAIKDLLRSRVHPVIPGNPCLCEACALYRDVVKILERKVPAGD